MATMFKLLVASALCLGLITAQQMRKFSLFGLKKGPSFIFLLFTFFDLIFFSFFLASMKPIGSPMGMKMIARQAPEGKTQAPPAPKNGTSDETKLRMYGKKIANFLIKS